MVGRNHGGGIRGWVDGEDSNTLPYEWRAIPELLSSRVGFYPGGINLGGNCPGGN